MLSTEKSNVQESVLNGKSRLFDLYEPKQHKPTILVWADLTIQDIDRLQESLNVEHIKQVLSDVFHLDKYEDDSREAIIMDLYYYTLRFAWDNNFSREKVSAFFSILKRVHEMAIETPFGNMEKTFQYFKELVLCHSVNRPPHSIELFDVDDVRKLTEQVIHTYFRHFKMYKYAFTPTIGLDLTFNYHGMSDVHTLVETEEEQGNDNVEEGSALSVELKEEPPVQYDEKSQARKELRVMIEKCLSDEIKAIKIGVEEQLKESEQMLDKKIEAAQPHSKKHLSKDGGKKKK